MTGYSRYYSEYSSGSKTVESSLLAVFLVLLYGRRLMLLQRAFQCELGDGIVDSSCVSSVAL